MNSEHFGHIGPDDDPLARCGKCRATYNPYKHGLNCPHCAKPEPNDVPVIDPSDPDTW